MTVGTVKIPDVWDELYPSRFLKAGLLKDKAVTLTISKVHVESMANDKTGGESDRGIISFNQTPMQLALNRTNGECLKAMFGKKVQSWVGKRVTFVPEVDKFGKDDVDAIRIKGSPDITSSIEIEIRMPKRKPKKRTLVPTGKRDIGTAPQPDPTPQPEPTVTADGEVIDPTLAQELADADAADRAAESKGN